MKDAKFDVYITRISRQVHPNMGMAGETLVELNRMSTFLIDELMKAVNVLVRHTNMSTITSRDVQNAVRLIFPGELGKRAVADGTKAITKFNSSIPTEKKSKGEKSSTKSKAVSRSFRAGLQLSIARVENVMRSMTCIDRMGRGAPVYMTAAIEYILSEILELSGNAARDNKKMRMKPRHILLAVRNDEELNKLFLNTIMGGGVIPNIHAHLLPKRSKVSN